MTDTTKTVLIVGGVLFAGFIVVQVVDSANRAAVQQTVASQPSTTSPSTADLLGGLVRGLVGGISDAVSRENRNTGSATGNPGGSNNSSGNPSTSNAGNGGSSNPPFWTTWGTPTPYRT